MKANHRLGGAVAVLAMTLVVGAMLSIHPRGHVLIADEPGGTTVDDSVAFERLKTLVGRWEGRDIDVRTGQVRDDAAVAEYRLTSAGTALFEWLHEGSRDEMVSVFFLDGDRLVLNHYCAAGNQPRLELVSATPTELDFRAVGGSNLDPAVDGHISRVRFLFRADGEVESYWTWSEGGEPDHVNRHEFARVG